MAKDGDVLVRKFRLLKIVYYGTVEVYSEPNYWTEFLKINKN